MTKVDILRFGPYPAWDQGPLDASFTAHRYHEAADKAVDKTAFLAQVGPYARAIATRGELGVTAAMIAARPALEVIAVYAVDLAAARARGIKVSKTPDVLTEDVADPGVAMMLALNLRFLGVNNALPQPHHGSGTHETRQAMGALLRENLLANFAGQPLLTPVP